MKNKVSQDQQSSSKNVLLWSLVGMLTVIAFYVNYATPLSSPVKAMVWVVWFCLSLLSAFFTSTGARAYAFALEAKNELLKVVWPTRKETVQTTSIVMIMVGVTGFVLWGIDSVMMWVIARLTHLG